METRSIHFKSDFLVRLMNEVDWSTPFSIRFFTTRAVSAKVVAFDGENYVGCELDESTGALLVPFERFTELYRQGLGTLRMELTYRLRNALYPDQYQDVVLPAQPVVCTNDQQEEFYLSLALTGDDDVEVSASVVAPFMTGPQGEQGEQGVGISTMAQTSASVASAGANVWKMALTDGREFSFTVLNGEKGAKGDTGAQGPQGAKGEKGDKGDTGARGPQGEQGPRGVPGQKGEKGAKGDKGDRGLTGESGPAGNTPEIGQNGNWWIGGIDTGVKADYSGTEAQRQATFEANEADRDQEFASKEATRDAANEAALNCADTLNALGHEIGDLDAQINGAGATPVVETYDYTSGYNINQTYCTIKGTHQLVNGKTYIVTISDTESTNTTLFRLYDSTNTSLSITEISGSTGTGTRSFEFTANDNGYVAMTVKKLLATHSYDVSIAEKVAANGLAHDVEVLQDALDELDGDVAQAIEDAADAKADVDAMDLVVNGGTPSKGTDTYDFTTGYSLNQTYCTQRGTIVLPAGKYSVAVSGGGNENVVLLRLYDPTNTNLVITEISGSSGTGDRTVTFETDESGIIAVTIKKLFAFCTVTCTTTDISNPTGLVGDVAALQAAATRKDKKVLIVGDSISTGTSSAAMSASNMPSYGSYDKWVDMLIEDGFFPRSTQNCSQHATGYVVQAGSSSWASHSDFLARVQYFVNNNTIDLDELDLIVVFGGVNDFKDNVPLGELGENDTTHFIPALEAFFEYLIENATQARICVLLPMRTSLVITNQLGKKIEDYDDAIKSVLKIYSIPYLDLTEQSGFCPTNDTFKAMWTLDWDDSGRGDGLHPNYEYQRKYLKKMIRRFLEPLI